MYALAVVGSQKLVSVNLDYMTWCKKYTNVNISIKHIKLSMQKGKFNYHYLRCIVNTYKDKIDLEYPFFWYDNLSVEQYFQKTYTKQLH